MFLKLILIFLSLFHSPKFVLEKEEICEFKKYCSIGSQFTIAPYKQRIYVVEEYEKKIFVYDFKGNLVFSFGRKGQGPGEFMQVNKLKILSNVLYIYDFI